MARISLSIDSATAEETWNFVCAFQRTNGTAQPATLNSDCTITIGGSAFGVKTPPMYIARANAMLAEYNALSAASA